MIDSVERVAEFFFSHAIANEAAGSLQPDVFRNLVELGVIHALVPHEQGGSELNSVEALGLIEALSRADASTGWVAMATGFCTAAAACYLPEDAARTIFESGSRPVIAGAGAPTGVAERAPGGYEISGRWRYGSGILHADWAHCGVFVEEKGKKAVDRSGSAIHLIVYVPMHEISLHGNWDVIGLRATGSMDFSVNGVFVPERFAIPAGRPKHRAGDALFGETLTLGTLVGHSGWTIGVARRLLDELAKAARAGGQRPGGLASNQAFLEAFASREGAVRGARALVYEVWHKAQDLLDAGQRLTVKDMTLIRLALAQANNVAIETATFAFRSAGGETLRQGHLQRMCRDIFAGGQHITSSPGVQQACGRVLAGLVDGEIWSGNGLVKPSPSAA